MSRLHVLDHGYVELIDSMGDDLRVVNAAQASFDKRSAGFGERERAILRFLMREEHGVPFEHVVFTFGLRLPIFLARQFVKHRMSSWSEQSGRYDEFESPQFYVPKNYEVRTQVGKPGAYTYEPVAGQVAESYVHFLNRSNETALHAYRYALSTGVAKEQARLVLPVNLYTNVVWTMNFRSLSNFLHLRNDSHAQAEAQVYAKAMEMLAEQIVPATVEAFIENGRPKL